MTRKLTAQEIRAVQALDGPARYSHFIKQVCDGQEVWGLREADGWVAMGDDSGTSMFPVWPHAEYAQLMATDDWRDASPSAIDLDAWMDVWLDNLEAGGDKVAVFPVPRGQGVVVAAEDMREHLEAELGNYE